ncbi:ABC transporter permease [Virgibacillus halophilus]|uniref:ABC transporter permease n=1 Tax=Tigheibacillus halophilus TaxID=361280 RepID=A0ABU5CEC0_9BACI|nr:ABC transporter permease [Virgibacillus halophilus]
MSGIQKKRTDSRLAKQLIDSVARHISTSQANILTIDQYAKKLGMPDKDRRKLMFAQFKEFLLYVIGKDQILSEEKITNQATAAPTQYFGITGWFILTTVWFLLVFQLLYKQSGAKMRQRMKLYGVSSLQQHISRMAVTLGVVTIVSMPILYGIAHYTNIELNFADYGRIILLMLLFGICLLEILAILENVIHSEKLALVLQYVIVFFLLVASGAIIPAIYFSLMLQRWLSYVFGSRALHWLQEITINQRLYADFSLLFWSAFAGALLMAISSAWKERMS